MRIFNLKILISFVWLLFFLTTVPLLGQSPCDNSYSKIKTISGLFSENSFSELIGKIKKEKKIKNFIEEQTNLDTTITNNLCHKLVIECVYYLSLTELYQGTYFQIPERVTRFSKFIKESNSLNDKQKKKYKEKLSTLLGEYHLELKEYTEAKENYFQSYQLALDERDSISPIRRAICYVNFGHGIALSTTQPDSLKIAKNKIDTGLVILDENIANIDTKNYARIKAYAFLYKARVFIKRYEENKNAQSRKELSTNLEQLKDLEKDFVNERISLMIPQYQAEIYLALGEIILARKKILSLMKIWDIKKNFENEELKRYYANHIDELLKIALAIDKQSITNKLYQSYISTETERRRSLKLVQINIAKSLQTLSERNDSLSVKTTELENVKEDLADKTRSSKWLLWVTLLLIIIGGALSFGMFIAYRLKNKLEEKNVETKKQLKQLEQEKKKLEKEKAKSKEQLVQLKQEKAKTLKEKNQLEAEKGNVEKNKDFLELLHQNSNVLAKFVDNKETNSNFDLFIKEAVNKTYELAKKPLEFDMLGIGIYNKENQEIELYVKEVRKEQEDIEPDKPMKIPLAKNSLTALAFNNKNKSYILENNYAEEGYKKYPGATSTTKNGKRSASLLYVKIGTMGVITIQSIQPKSYGEEQIELLKTIGENIFNAIISVGSSIKIKEIVKALEDHKENLKLHQKDTSHRIKNHLAALVSSINFQLENSKVKDNILIQKELLKVKARTQAVSLVHKMVHQNWDKESEKFISPQKYFTELAQKFLVKGLGYSKSQISLNVDLEGESDMHVEILKDLGTVIVELGLNVYEHAYPDGENHWIQLQIDTVEDKRGKYLRLIVADKGIGKTQNKKKPNSGSIGQELLTRLIKRLNGKIKDVVYDTESKTGTKYIITIPKK